MPTFMLVNKLIKKLLLTVRSRVILLFIGICIVIIIYHYLLFMSCAKVIPLQQIAQNLLPAISDFKPLSEEQHLCNIMPVLINGSWPLISVNVSEDYLDNLAVQTDVQPGGSWKPSSCVPQHHVALVIPYRNRYSHLKIFLAHMHPFLQFQHLHYQIFVVEQTDQRPFNRAKLFNIGFKEADKMFSFHCYIFHDVDLLPLNVNNIYACTKLPRHLSANIDVFDYKIPYDWIFGGAISILKTQFEDVNGFSNKFFGWGGEDDDFYNRVTKSGNSICRFEPKISQYIMLSHKKETPNEDRFYYLSTGLRRIESDGLNSLRYSVKNIELKSLYTRVLVDV